MKVFLILSVIFLTLLRPTHQQFDVPDFWKPKNYVSKFIQGIAFWLEATIEKVPLERYIYCMKQTDKESCENAMDPSGPQQEPDCSWCEYPDLDKWEDIYNATGTCMLKVMNPLSCMFIETEMLEPMKDTGVPNSVGLAECVEGYKSSEDCAKASEASSSYNCSFCEFPPVYKSFGTSICLQDFLVEEGACDMINDIPPEAFEDSTAPTQLKSATDLPSSTSLVPISSTDLLTDENTTETRLTLDSTTTTTRSTSASPFNPSVKYRSTSTSPKSQNRDNDNKSSSSSFLTPMSVTFVTCLTMIVILTEYLL